ncbi:MAG: hypothetical protein SFX73_27870 [Kofleriaceae bacterium]|nr:hypothetical protein [Kofleriaceae bacterium]
MRALLAYMDRVDASLTSAHRERARQREAHQLGLAPEAWGAILTANLDLALLREIHRAVTGARPTIRRADKGGRWTIAAARAGHMRSQPQAFRAGERIAPAWDHGTLKRQLAHAMSESLRLPEPVARAATLIWNVARAQPFLGDNERVAMVLGARVLRSAGLPAPAIGALERDEAFANALVEADAEQRTTLEQYVRTALWDEALAFAEWFAAVPDDPHGRWSLRDEHAAAVRARQNTLTFAEGELAAIAAQAADALLPRVGETLGIQLGEPKFVVPVRDADRLRLAIEATGRGRRVCPHAPMRELRWRVDEVTGLELVLVVGVVGQGLTGAAAIHAALEHPGVPTTGVARAVLLVPGEPTGEREQRVIAWAAEVAAAFQDARPRAR